MFLKFRGYKSKPVFSNNSSQREILHHSVNRKTLDLIIGFGDKAKQGNPENNQPRVNFRLNNFH